MFLAGACVFAAVLFPAVYLLVMVYHTLIYVAATALPSLIFTALPAVTFALALGVVFSKQPVHSLLCLITIFFNTVILYLYTGSEFLAFLFLIVYVGAIAILFLFVIMLLHLKKPERPHSIGAITPIFAVVFLVCIGIDDMVSFSLEDFFMKGGLITQHTEPTSIDALA
jgi:NADH:ubiquinone oxidoreductase subunit 6 (subunit J)